MDNVRVDVKFRREMSQLVLQVQPDCLGHSSLCACQPDRSWLSGFHAKLQDPGSKRKKIRSEIGFANISNEYAISRDIHCGALDRATMAVSIDFDRDLEHTDTALVDINHKPWAGHVTFMGSSPVLDRVHNLTDLADGSHSQFLLQCLFKLCDVCDRLGRTVW